MPTTAGTSPTEVRVEIDTRLTDADITNILDVVERDIDREYDSGTFEDTQHRQDFEAVLTALRIASGRDRRADSAASGRSQTTYETAEVDSLRQRVRRLDPGNEFGRSGTIVRDSSRHVSTTTEDA